MSILASFPLIFIELEIFLNYFLFPAPSIFHNLIILIRRNFSGRYNPLEFFLGPFCISFPFECLD
jgi:hypothetical protein